MNLRSADLGVTTPQLATHLHTVLKVNNAMNLDGGGSSTIWIKDHGIGGIINYPSEAKLRPIINALVVVPD